MLIEFYPKHEGPVEVPIGNEKYLFEPDESGRRVADVWREDHIICFLNVGHLYRLVPGQDIPPLVREAMEREGLAVPDKVTKPADKVTIPSDAVTNTPPSMKRPEIIAALKGKGIPFKATAKNDELRGLLAGAS